MSESTFQLESPERSGTSVVPKSDVQWQGVLNELDCLEAIAERETSLEEIKFHIFLKSHHIRRIIDKPISAG